jgi:hypothetical protein
VKDDVELAARDDEAAEHHDEQHDDADDLKHEAGPGKRGPEHRG